MFNFELYKMANIIWSSLTTLSGKEHPGTVGVRWKFTLYGMPVYYSAPCTYMFIVAI